MPVKPREMVGVHRERYEGAAGEQREGEPMEEEIFGGCGWFLDAGDDSFWASCVCAGQRARWRTESLNWAAKRGGRSLVRSGEMAGEGCERPAGEQRERGNRDEEEGTERREKPICISEN